MKRETFAARDGRRRGEEFDANGQERARREGPWRRQHLTALQVGELDPRQVRAHPLARARLAGLAAVDFDPPHADGLPARQKVELLLPRDSSGDEASGHDRPEARHRERAVDRKSNAARLTLGFGVPVGELDDRALQCLEPLARPRGNRHDRGVFESGTARHLANVRGRDLHEIGRHAIRLRHGDDAAADPEHANDLEMLPGLRHDRLVGCDDEEHRIDPSGAGEHVPDEALVTGHVHEGDADALPLGMGEPEVDRDAPALLLRQAVRVDAGQGANESGLAVVDVTGGSDEEAIHGGRLQRW